MKREITEGAIISNQQVADEVFLLYVMAPRISKISQPGQFVNFYFENSIRIFPRPFSIAGVEGENLRILYKRIGPQTLQMSLGQPGDLVRLLGPLGNTFPESKGTALLVGGGLGVAPLLFLYDHLNRKGMDCRLFYGGRTKTQIPYSCLPGNQLIIATDDGSVGFGGNVVDCLLNEIEPLPRPFTVYACGPEKMLESLIDLAGEKGFPLYVSLEKIMACGLGLCQGCAVRSSNEQEQHYKLVCKDGPVFAANELHHG